MPNDIQGGQKTPTGPLPAAAAAAPTAHQSFMTVAGQAVLVVVLAEVAGMGETEFKVCGAIIAGLWLAFLINNSAAVFGVLTVKRK